MRILIIGGTRFVGRHLVEAAVARGHELTLFTRGQSAPDLFPDLDHRRGDRDGGDGAFASLGDSDTWDAVIDTCGYVPRVVTKSAEFLADRVAHYTFVSSLSVYAEFGSGVEDESPLATMADPTIEEITGETYGALKVLCEQAAEAAMPGRVLNVRPGLIVGPHDPTDRFTWWPARVARGGAILAPGNPQRRLQFIDARDLAAWMLDSLEVADADGGPRTGVYNAVGPTERPTMEGFLRTCAEAAGPEAPERTFVWVSEKFLAMHHVAPYSQMPLWIPEIDDAFRNDKAVAAGMTFRPVAETVADTLAWHRTREGHQLKSGLEPQLEADLIDVWRNWKE